MTYQLSPSETPDDGLRRIVDEELSAGIAQASPRDVDLDEVIHEERKRCKRIRGVLALFRASLADRRTHDRRYRDIARRLAGARDAAAVLEGFSATLDEYPDSRGPDTEEVLLALTRRHEEAVSSLAGERGGLDRLILDFESARESVPDLVVEADDWPAIAGGLRYWYRRGRRTWKRLEDGGTAAEFHKWRKSVKYHLYHMTLLEDLDSSWMKDRQLAAERVQELLGQSQDLAVLEELLPALGIGPEARAIARKLAGRRQERLQLDALSLGHDVYASKTNRLVKRVKKRWRKWYSPEPEPAGE